MLSIAREHFLQNGWTLLGENGARWRDVNAQFSESPSNSALTVLARTDDGRVRKFEIAPAESNLHTLTMHSPVDGRFGTASTALQYLLETVAVNAQFTRPLESTGPQKLNAQL
jgi:hypothetical protein